ncbi:phosphotransferase [Nannocystis punicea]|uniref:Phosphotransferase n=1 Tax=Nannocystis punicea TaxID=2995304 RepID=A0ABY7HBD8_9BACT|nr:phosphotransferase [Nannocystis poenicansa]WAS96422.1 phosphotransferase [Nannocystis poenicansa]
MSAADPEHGGLFASQLAAVETLLSAGLEAPVRVTAAERVSEEGRRNLILRCAVAGALDDGPTSVIVKQVVMHGYDPDAVDSWDVRRFFGDWAGAEFLGAVAGESLHGPRFHGGDRARGLIVLEDLGEHHDLVEPLLEGDAAGAEQALLALAARLGAMHADTIGGAARFEAIARAIDSKSAGVAATCLRQADELREQADRVVGLLERLGSPAAAGLADDVATICEAVAHPGPFLAYIHGDPCPDNVFYSGGRLRLIDFEFGYFGHALRDGAHARMQFPTCWCANRLPEALLSRVERSYRAELARGCPAAQDDRLFESALAVMSGYWLIASLAWLLERAIEADSDWGIATTRSRILARLEAFITAATAFDRLPALRGTADALLEQLHRRWPESQPLPLYPAFR